MTRNLKSLLAIASTLLGVACGDDVENPDAEYFDVRTDRLDIEPKLLAQIDVNQVHIEFTQVWTTPDGDVETAPTESFSPSIMILQKGPIVSGLDPVSAVVANSPSTPTTGEIYYALTGNEPLEEMRELQELEAHRLQRDSEFIRVDPALIVASPIIDKAWSDPPAWITVPPAHHFTKTFFNQESWTCGLFGNCGSGIPLPNPIIVYGCGNRFSAVMGTGQPGATACPVSNGWMRVGIANLGGSGGMNPIIGQMWFGPSTAGAWSAGPAWTLNYFEYLVLDWNANNVRMATAGTRAPTASEVFRIFTTKIIPN